MTPTVPYCALCPRGRVCAPQVCWEWTWYLSNNFQFFIMTVPLLLAVAYGFT